MQLFFLGKLTRPGVRNIRVNCKINDSLKNEFHFTNFCMYIGSSENDFTLFAKMRNVSDYNKKNLDNKIMDAYNNGLYPTYNTFTRAFKKDSFLLKRFVDFCVSFKPEAVFKGCNLYGFIRLDKCGTVCLKLVLMMRFMYNVRLLRRTYFLKNKFKKHQISVYFS